MNNEFKKLSQGNVTRYVLESASGGGTSSGSDASVSMPIGGMQRRKGDNLIAQEADKNTVPASTPRNFVAKNAKSSGAGAHKDKSKTIPRKEKHKKPYMEDHSTATGGWGQGSYDTYAGGNHGRGVAENPEWYSDEANSMSSSQLKSIYKHAMKLRQAVQRMQQQGDTLEPWQQSKVTKAADYLDAVFNAVDDEHDMGEEQGMEEDMSRRGFLKGAGAMAAGISAASSARADNQTDPNKLIAIVNIDGESKEFNLTGRFKGDVKSQLHQAEDFITEFLEKRDINFSNLELRYQGAVLKTQNTGSVREEQGVAEEWSQKYKSSINCSHPKGFSQKAHCAGKKKHNEDMSMEATCPDCGMCETHGNLNEIAKGAKDANGFTRCWPGKHAVGTKKGKNGGQVRNCKPNEGVDSYFGSLTNKLSEVISSPPPPVPAGAATTKPGAVKPAAPAPAAPAPAAPAPAAPAPAAPAPATTVDPIQQKSDQMQQGILDRIGKRFGLPPGSSQEDVKAAQQAYLDKNDPAAAAQNKQNMDNIAAGGSNADNKPVQLSPKAAPAPAAPNTDNAGALSAGKANKSPIAIMLAQPTIANNQQMLDVIAPTLGLPTGSTIEQILAADDARNAKAGNKYAASTATAPVAESLNRAVDTKGRTQKQWFQLIRSNFPDAKIRQSKMIDGPCFAILPNGKKLEWEPVEQGMTEGAKVDRQAKHITASMMKKGKSKKDAEGIAWAHIKHPKNESVDTYFESLDVMLERQLEPNMDLDTWNNNFQNADPNKYHQFKNKTPEKKK